MDSGASRVSLTVNVRQAIKAEDTRLLTTLITSVDAKTICSTAKELSGEEATKLLEFLGQFLSSDARRVEVVMEWTRELIISHATYISSQSRTKLKLKPILDVLNHRLADNSELIHMRHVASAILRGAEKASVEVTTPTRSADSKPTLRWTAE